MSVGSGGDERNHRKTSSAYLDYELTKSLIGRETTINRAGKSNDNYNDNCDYNDNSNGN